MPADEAGATTTAGPEAGTGAAYRAAFTDWLACASRGVAEPAARAASAAGDPVVALGTAGHVLDFDDTFLPGIAHLSAPVAPAALSVGAREGATVGEVLTAYADGFEAMGALAAAVLVFEHLRQTIAAISAATLIALLLAMARLLPLRFLLLRACGLLLAV